jgi:predicted RNA binding protein YcfA (HicA-like mRNA interferase family)
MIKLPRITGKEAIRALEKADFFIKRQSGSHVIMKQRKRGLSPFSEMSNVETRPLYFIFKSPISIYLLSLLLISPLILFKP